MNVSPNLLPLSDPGQAPTTGGWRLDHSYAQLPSVFHAPVAPTSVAEPRLVIFNRRLAETLGLEAATLTRPENAAWFAGNSLPPGASPLAQAYAGHQYGRFVMLGDGRALLLGEQLTPHGERFDIQLKGSGPTPFSRRGDGRAALGPMLREYLISEAMHAFGIPTTRSLAVTASGEAVYRDTPLPGAVLTRVAASHLRVGTFEWAAACGEPDAIRVVADYTIQRHYPKLCGEEQPYLALLHAVMHRQASLVARWQGVGFIHGVMNTDNMALSGETIDYGPCAFMDTYQPATVFSSIDHQGRYAYANQPAIAHWNLSRFASTLLPLLHPDADAALALANDALKTFPHTFRAQWLLEMRAKFGLFNEEMDDAELIESLLTCLQEHGADFTNTFRDLSADALPDCPLAGRATFQTWHARWQDRLKRQPQPLEEARGLMRRHNPAFIPRNHKVEEALAAATVQGDLSVLEQLLEVLAHPYDYTSNRPEFSTPRAPSAGIYRTFCGT